MVHFSEIGDFLKYLFLNCWTVLFFQNSVCINYEFNENNEILCDFCHALVLERWLFMTQSLYCRHIPQAVSDTEEFSVGESQNSPKTRTAAPSFQSSVLWNRRFSQVSFKFNLHLWIPLTNFSSFSFCLICSDSSWIISLEWSYYLFL